MILANADSVFAQPDSSVPLRLTHALDRALDGGRGGYEKHLRVVQEVDELLAGKDHANDEVWFKARLVEAVVNLRLSRFDTGAEQIANLIEQIPQTRFPELWFRCRSVEAALLFFQGKREKSLRAFERVLAGDLDKVGHRAVARARVNYAAVLNESGRVDEATQLYEQVMLHALEHRHDHAALHSGNHLIALLIDQGDYRTARQTLEELQTIGHRLSGRLLSRRLKLHELNLRRLDGHAEAAVSGLRTFLREGERLPPVLSGLAYRGLADALREAGALDEALIHARKSIELLADRSNQSTASRVSLAQILLLKSDYEAVLEELSAIDSLQELVPARRMLVDRLRLEARLRKDGRTAEAELLQDILRADVAHDKQVSRTRSDYLEAKLDATRQTLQLQQQKIRTADAIAASVAERKYRNILISCMIAGALLGYLLVYLYFRRRAERLLLIEQQGITQDLEDVVKAKTEQLKANLEARAKMARALERKKRMEAIGLLAGNVAHDINNLLQVISNANESLASDTSSEEERSALLSLSNQSLSHGKGIIRNLLAFSRQQRLSTETISVRDYLRTTAPLFEAAVGESVQLQLDDESGEAFVLVDVSQLTTSLLNLLTNAVDAMPNGGRIEVSADVINVDVVSGESSAVPGKYLRICVCDTGSGMTDEQVARAFEPFYSTKDVESGTGLGLSSAYGFAKQSHGDLRIESTPQVGTRAEMLLPLVQPPATATRPTPAKARKQMPRRRVLLVEDHDGVAATLQAVLQHLNFEPIRTSSGEESQDLLREDSAFDFVLSDVRMPGSVDGPALARWVSDELPDIPIFLMSGYTEQLIGNDTWPLIQKPFNVAALTRFLEDNLETSAR